MMLLVPRSECIDIIDTILLTTPTALKMLFSALMGNHPDNQDL